jgi:hypothetical protein
MAVWDKFGLVSSHFLGGRAKDPRYASLPRATRFRIALEEQGGLFALYGRFLAGRADLLPSPHLRQLRKTKPHRDPSGRSMLDRELEGRVADLRVLRTAPGAEVYAGRYRERPVVVEFYCAEADPLAYDAWKRFSREIRVLRDEVESKITRDHVLDQFEEWLRLARDVPRRRSILDNLGSIPAECVTRYPRPIGELQSDRCLVYEGQYADVPALQLHSDAPGVEKKLQLLVEGLLEQSLLVSLVDAEMWPDSFAVVGERTVNYHSLPLLAPLPAEWHYELLQYMASTVAGQSPRALHMLSRMCSKHDPYAGEQRLMRELSGLQPELKINIVTPESVTALENYWRSLANTSMRAPLFLELFHRQWTVIGQYNGEVAASADVIAESLWPVLGRILRLRFSELATTDKAREWAANSGLMLLTAARQVGMILEQVRDNDLAIVMDHQEYESSEAKLNQRTISLIRSTLALVVFLLTVYFTVHAPGAAVKLVAGSAAAISAVVLALFVARIE